jgi:hypothetical protein
LFPDLPKPDFDALVEDIRRHGVKVPILVHRGQILDGRQRYRACQLLNLTCPTVSWNGRDPWFEVQSRNLMRRHLAKDQIYAICKIAAERFPELAISIEAAKMDAKGRQGRKAASAVAVGGGGQLRSRGRNKESADAIGAQFGVSGSTVKRVDRLAREAPDLVPKVATGELSVKKALRQLVLHHESPKAKAATRPSPIQLDGGRIQHLIRTEWRRCPAEHRRAFLYGLQEVFREIVAEHKAAQTRRPPDLANGDTAKVTARP